jgi:hypothetical protein
MTTASLIKDISGERVFLIESVGYIKERFYA